MSKGEPSIFKAYDIRGLVGEELTPEFAFEAGLAFARFLELQGEPGTLLIGEDMRPSSPELASAFSAGALSNGMDVIRIGLASTDLLYFASGKLNLPGAMFTASHNPAQYNGIKLCLSGARPVGKESGLAVIEDFVLQGSPISLRSIGAERHQNVIQEYVTHLLSLVKLSNIRPLKVVIDAGNGMAGYTAPFIFQNLNVEVVEMYFELDGNFPNHEANPIDPANMRDLQAAVLRQRADIGLAFDGDADRCFLVNEKGEIVDPSLLTALIAKEELRKFPKASIIYNLISSRAVAEVIAENGGVAIRSRVGHSYIKKLMAETGAVFGGEHSGHFYFRDFWSADSGALAALYALAALGNQSSPLSELLAPFQRYFSSGEINSSVTDASQKILQLENEFSNEAQVQVDYLDGMTISTPLWWFNVRASNTEPLLRANIEATSEAELSSIQKRVLAIIRA